MKKWIKKKALTAVTGVAVAGVAAVSLGNASSLETLFNPGKFEKYENRHRSEEYDYVAGNDGDAELADKDKDGEEGSDKNEEKQVLQVTEQEETQNEQNRAKEEKSADLGIADQTADNSSADKNKNAVELAPTGKKNNSDTAAAPSNTSGNGNNSSGQTGNNSGQTSDDSGNKNNNKTDGRTDNGNSKDNTGTDNNGSNGNDGNNGNSGTGDNSNPTPVIPTVTPVPIATPTVVPVITPTAVPVSTPEPTPIPWEDVQLKPKDPTVTKDGTLTALKVNLKKETYAVGDSFSAEDAEVTATFFNTDGSSYEKTLDYGRNGYEVSLYTKKKGTYTAVFKYGGISVRLTYQVMSNYVTLNYMAWYGNKYYGSYFPGEGLKEISETDFAELDKLREFPYTFPSTGNVINLTDIHRRMIAYLEDERIKNIFENSVGGNYNATVFLNEENGYLKNMLQGFGYMLSNDLLDDRSYVYYPAEGWDTGSRNVINIVADVPEGYWIRRVTENEDSLKDYKGDQVLEKYTGSDACMNVPMGTTGINLKEKAVQVTEISIPQSVMQINTKSIAENLPNLESYTYAEGETDTVYGSFRITDGLLLSNDGRTLLSVPAGKKSVTIPSTVRKLAEGCFRGLSADAVIIFESETPPVIEGDTGYQGMILTPDSDYNVICKAYMFRFAQENKNIRFAAVKDKTVRYTYLEEGPMLVQTGDASVLMGIPQDTRGRYQVSQGIQTIASGAFAGCKRVTDIEFPENVTKLEAESLVLSGGVESITLSGAQTEISEKIFGDPKYGAEVPDITVWVNQEDYQNYLKDWTSVLDPVYGAGAAAGILKASTGSYIYEDGAKYEQIRTKNGTGYRLLRMYVENKRTFQIKDGTVEIAANAFGENAHLEILSIPESVSKIGTGAFENCTALETITCADKAVLADAAISESTELLVRGTDFASFVLKNGVLYGIDVGEKQTLINVGSNYQGELPVNKNTTVLYKEALKNCIGVTELQFADKNLEKIGKGCFQGCSQFQELDFSGYSKLSEIGESAFEDCISLKQISIPQTVTDIGAAAFKNCISLENLKADDIQEIGNAAFYNCSSLTDTAFLTGVKVFGDEAFYGCRSFTEIELPETLSQMGESCFENCVALKKVSINGTLTGISRYCFYGCRDLKEVMFKDAESRSSSIRVIGVEAFGQCISLEEIDLEGQTSLTQIGTGAFADCSRMTKVKLPLNLKKIPDQCFAGCKELSILQSSADTVIESGTQIFGDTLPAFIHVWVKENMIDAYKDNWKTVLDADYGEGTAENIIEAINDRIEIVKGVVFEITENGRILKEASPDAVPESYNIPDDTIEIASDAFAGCTRLKELLFPQGASIILDDRCFKGCTGLSKIYIYSAVPQWGEEVFMDCTGLSKIYIGEGDGAEIPKIGTRAFKNCTGLAGEAPVEIRSATSVWGEECFADCTTLKSIGLNNEARNTLEVLEDGAMRGCTSLRVLLTSKFTGLRTIGSHVFEDCDSLNAPAVPAGVTSIGEGCFMNCDNVTTVSFYGALDEYPRDCFKNCPKLTRTGGTAAAFNGLKRIGESAYEGCVSLVSSASWNLERYANLESIGDRAFNGCESLSDSVLGTSITSIGSNAFDGCASMHTLTINAEQVPAFGEVSLAAMPDDFCIRVPDSQASEDSIYKAYLEVLKSVFGEENALRILDSVSDGARERYISEKEKEAQKVSGTEEKNQKTEKTETEETSQKAEAAEVEKTETEKAGQKAEATEEEKTADESAEETTENPEQEEENPEQNTGETETPDDSDADGETGSDESTDEDPELTPVPESEQIPAIQETEGETE